MLSWTRLTRLTLASVALASASVSLVAPALPAAADDPGPPLTPACAWTVNSVHTSNQSSLDSSATYYGLPIPIQPGLQITIHGRFPDARYASFQAYRPGGGLFTVNGVNSWLTDYQIQPDPGSINPWQAPVSETHQGKDDQQFTLTLSSDVMPGQASMLPLVPAGVTSGTGNLSYRVYLPVGNNFAQVPLPTVTFTLNGESVQVPACAPAASSTSTTTPTVAPAAAASTDGSVQFSRTGGKGGATNADSGYLRSGVVLPANGDVLVFSGKAPTASKRNHPAPWPGPGIDERYWSACIYLDPAPKPLVVNQLPDGTTDYGCRNDIQTKINPNGYYIFVVGTEAQRSEIDQVPGATFLPFSTADPAVEHTILLRNMLANPDFAEAVQNVPESSTPADAAAVMGPYYPAAALCPLAGLAQPDGIATCLASAPRTRGGVGAQHAADE